jgi:hypothetical protein
MLGYVLQNPGRAVRALAGGREMWGALRDEAAGRREHRHTMPRYDADPDWERRMHQLLGAPWPCDTAADFRYRWAVAVGDLASRGVYASNGFDGHDGDAALVRCVWCLARHLRPIDVVETGVGHGFTTRFILEALERNGTGELHSIDPGDPGMRGQTGIAVEERLHHRWDLVEGSSRRCLPPLLKDLVEIDMFVHDSKHTEANVRFELDRAWQVLSPGGAMIVDDVDSNWGFESFRHEHPGVTSFVCNAEPVRGLRRAHDRGQFGVILKST